MTANRGNLTNISNHVIVGSGHNILVIGHGNALLPNSQSPLTLNQCLHAPKLIKNLVFARKFTIDNGVFVEFVDPFGFFVKDLQTGMPLMRCDSSGDLYPLTTRPPTQLSTPSSFIALSNNLWHNRLGHPGAAIISSLHRNNFIFCKKSQHNSICQSCQFGKQIKMSFYESLSHTLLPFDIVHSDLWTSPTLSYGGHRYYILFLDDFTNFLWNFPIAHKSQVYSTFLHFRNHIKTQFERDIKCFQCDNREEYENTSFDNFCEQEGFIT